MARCDADGAGIAIVMGKVDAKSRLGVFIVMGKFFRRLLGQSCRTTSSALLGGYSDFLASAKVSAKVRVPVPDQRIPGSSPADGSFWENRPK